MSRVFRTLVLAPCLALSLTLLPSCSPHGFDSSDGAVQGYVQGVLEGDAQLASRSLGRSVTAKELDRHREAIAGVARAEQVSSVRVERVDSGEAADEAQFLIVGFSTGRGFVSLRDDHDVLVIAIQDYGNWRVLSVFIPGGETIEPAG